MPEPVIAPITQQSTVVVVKEIEQLPTTAVAPAGLQLVALVNKADELPQPASSSPETQPASQSSSDTQPRQESSGSSTQESSPTDIAESGSKDKDSDKDKNKDKQEKTADAKDKKDEKPKKNYCN